MITSATNANINFAYFCLNFPSNFIAKCWEGDQNAINHLGTKFMALYKTKGTALMPFFFSELDRENQVRLSKWINDNYLSFMDLGTITQTGMCSVCGCTQDNCSQCINKTGKACSWANDDHTLCSACIE